MGITFDGDADRALFADEHGNVVNGDAVLLLAARHLKALGALTNDTVVATTMSNMGLEGCAGSGRRSRCCARRWATSMYAAGADDSDRGRLWAASSPGTSSLQAVARRAMGC